VMMAPAPYNITIHQGATFKLDLQYLDSNSNPVNMNGYTVNAQLWNRLNTDKITDFDFSWTTQASGIFQIKLTNAVTSGITEQGQYDILLSQPNGDKYYLMEGIAFLDQGVSYR
jgi:hypothetical protein